MLQDRRCTVQRRLEELPRYGREQGSSVPGIRLSLPQVLPREGPGFSTG